MIDVENLKSGIEYQTPTIKIAIKVDDHHVITRITPLVTSTESKEICLTLSISDEITLTSITGSEFGSILHGKGLTRLATNYTIQALSLVFGPDMIISGKLSDLSDPDAEGQDRFSCFVRRQNFALDTGLTLEDSRNPDTRFRAKLSELKVRKTGITSTNPVSSSFKEVDIDDFWPAENKPGLLPTDINFIKDVNADAFDMSNLTSVHMLDKYAKQVKIESNILFVLFFLLSFSISFKLFVFNSNSADIDIFVMIYIILIIFCSALLSSIILKSIQPRLYSCKRYIAHRKTKAESILLTYECFKSVIQHHPGIIKRLITAYQSTSFKDKELQFENIYDLEPSAMQINNPFTKNSNKLTDQAISALKEIDELNTLITRCKIMLANF